MTLPMGHTQTKVKEGRYFLRNRWDESPAVSQQTGGPGYSPTVRAALEAFYAREVSIPDRLAEARRARLDLVLPGLLARLQRNTSRVRCLEPVYVGSAAEGLDIRGSGDVNIVLPLSVVGRLTPVPSSHHPGLFEVRLPRLLNLKEVTEDRWSGWRGDGDCLSPILANQMFGKFVSKWHEVRKHEGVNVRTPGSGENAPVRVVVSVGDDAGADRGESLISIEIIPGIVVGKKTAACRQLLVAKDYRASRAADVDAPTSSLWTEVSYEAERALLSKVNRADGCCRAQALKILKALRRRDERLAELTTYQMKQALLHLCDLQVDQSHWQRRSLERCFAELLGKLIEFVSAGELPHFFRGHLDLLADVPGRALDRIESRLKVLSKREKELVRLLGKGCQKSELR